MRPDLFLCFPCCLFRVSLCFVPYIILYYASLVAILGAMAWLVRIWWWKLADFSGNAAVVVAGCAHIGRVLGRECLFIL